jgi:hypothetical protein
LTICQSHYSGTGGTGGSGAGGVDGDHIAMGNPSATTNIANENNYLMEKAQFKLSYNRSKQLLTASWHLDPTWIGTATRQDDFRAIPLPAGWQVLQATLEAVLTEVTLPRLTEPALLLLTLKLS